MCRRLSLTRPELVQQYLFPDELWDGMPPTFPGQEPRDNIHRTEDVLAAFHPSADEPLAPTMLRWGLMPRWASPAYPTHGHPTLSIETFLQSPILFELFRRQRCIIAADGYFDWRDGIPQRASFFHLRDKEPFLFAGLWEKWKSPSGAAICSCTILTTRANRLIEHFHPRMPVILRKDKLAVWLDASRSQHEHFLSYLLPYPADDLMHKPVHVAEANPRPNQRRNGEVRRAIRA